MLVELSTEMRHLYLLLVSANFIIGSTPPDLIVLILALFGLFYDYCTLLCIHPH